MPGTDKKKTTKNAAAQIVGEENKNPRKKDILTGLGHSGTSILNGQIQEDYNSSLSGLEGRQKFEEMRKSDAMVYASLLACELPIRSTKWFVDAHRDMDDAVSDESKEIANFVEDALFNKMEITWDSLLVEILTMLPFGFSAFEKVWTIKDGMILLQKLASRKQTTIDKWETPDGQAGITQVVPYGNQKFSKTNRVGIPAWKLAIFTFRQEGDNYEGVSVLRSSYKHWFMKDHLYRFDAVKHERQSVGIPVLYPTEGAGDPDLEILAEIGENIRANEQSAVVMPGPKSAGWEIEMLDMKAGNTSNIFESINHHNREIAKNVLAQFLELGNTESGSRALSEDQSDLFTLGLTAIANHICDVFNRYIIPELVDLNFNTESYPHLKFNKLGSVNYEALSTALSTLANSGILIPDDDLETHVRDTMDLPSKMEDGGSNRPTPPNASDNGGDKPTPPPAPKKKDDNGEAIDPKELKAHEGCNHNVDWNDDLFFDEEYMNISAMFNDEAIINIQNSGADAILKKKGFKLNEYSAEAFRPLTFAERKVNFKALNRAMDSFEAILEERLGTVTDKMKADLVKQIKKAVDSNDINAVGKISAKYTGELSQALTDIQKEMFEIGKRSASVEMSVKMPPTSKEVRGALRVQNDNIVKGFKDGIDNKTRSAVIQVVNTNAGSITNTTAAVATAAATELIDASVKKMTQNLRTLGVVGAVNLGRATIYERYPEKIYGFQYSAILDSRTTDYCASLDGLVVKAGSPEFFKYKPPKHYNCRSIRVEILNEETFKPKFTGVPARIKAPKTIDGFKKMKAPIILKNSPAIVQIENEIKERNDKIIQLEASGKYKNRIKQHKKRVANLQRSLETAFSEALVQHTLELIESDKQA